MKITDVTEDMIFATLGKGRDPDYKPVELKPIENTPFDFSTIKSW
jgi:hypothetical protein